MTGPARIAPLLGVLLLGACTNPYDPGQRAAGGALIGAGTGAAVGGLAGGPRGVAIGALAGGLGGAALGAATTPTPPQYQPGYAPQGYGQTYAPPPPVGAQAYYPPPGYAPGPPPPYQGPPQQAYQQPPPAAYQQPPPGSYWQPQPYIAPPDPYAGYRY